MNSQDASPPPPVEHRPMTRHAERLVVFVATGAYAGYAPVAPGTVGSVWGVTLAWGMTRGLPAGPVYWAVAAILAGAAVPFCSWAARVFGREDPPQVVLDEIVAVPLVFVLSPLDLASAAIGFCWFRFFDVVKPWPVHRLERLPAGWGIVADDLAAALYAALAVYVTLWLLGA